MLAPLAVVAFALPAVAPLLRGLQVTGHDDLEHLMRAAEFGRAVAAGVWWPQWAPSLGGGYGEPIFVFNPPLFYVLTTLVGLAGGSVVWSVNLSAALLLVVGALGAYAWAAWAFGRWGGMVAGVAYAWAPFLLRYLYVVQGLPMFAAMCLAPWALWGLTWTARAPSRRRLAVAALMVGLLLLASTPAALVLAPAFLGQVVALAPWRRPAGAARAVAALALGSLLAAAFWLPAMAERHLLRFDRLLRGVASYEHNFPEPWRLVSPYLGSGNPSFAVGDTVGFGPGEANLALAACAVALLAGSPAPGALGRQVWLAVGLVAVGSAMSLELSRPVWAQGAQLQYLQSPWRFLVLPALGFSILAGAPAALLGRRRPRAAVGIALACAAVLVAGNWARARPAELRDRTDERYAPAAIAREDRGKQTRREYETIWAEVRPAPAPARRLVAVRGSAEIAEARHLATAHYQRFRVRAEGPARLRLNTHYFPGWRVFVDGEERPIDHDNPHGLIELEVERGRHVVEARFEPTPARLLARALSAAALGALALLLIRPRGWSLRGSPRIPTAASSPTESLHRPEATRPAR